MKNKCLDSSVTKEYANTFCEIFGRVSIKNKQIA